METGRSATARRAALGRQKQSPGRKHWLETGARIGSFNFPSSEIARQGQGPVRLDGTGSGA
jgi:hypothetical protein